MKSVGEFVPFLPPSVRKLCSRGVNYEEGNTLIEDPIGKMSEENKAMGHHMDANNEAEDIFKIANGIGCSEVENATKL